MRFIKRTLGGMLFGTIFAGAGLLVMFLFATLSTLTCARDIENGGRCTLVTTGLTGSETQQIALDQLTGARVERSTGSSRRGRSNETYRVVLTTHNGSIPFTSAYSSGYDAKQQTASRIAAFVLDPRTPDLAVSQDDRWFGYLLGGIFAGVGSLVFLGSLIGIFRALLGGFVL